MELIVVGEMGGFGLSLVSIRLSKVVIFGFMVYYYYRMYRLLWSRLLFWVWFRFFEFYVENGGCGSIFNKF